MNGREQMHYAGRVTIQGSERTFRVCATCDEASVAQRTHPARHRYRRHHYATVHGRERLPGPEGRPDVCNVDPGGRHLDGGPALLGRPHRPGKQHHPDHRLGGRHTVGSHLRPPRPRDRRLVERLPLLGDHVRVRGRRFAGRHVLHPAAPSARDRLRPALPRGRGGR